MKAIILAGGEGTRLRPLTYQIPKALIPVGKKTLTELVIDILNKYGIKDIILSIAYKKEMIRQYFKSGKKFGVNISYIEEKTPLGTAGPLIILNKKNKPIEKPFFMINGDNLFDINLAEMIKFHRHHKAHATIALSQVEDPRNYGVAVLKGNMITKFIEKPISPPTNYINSGYYILDPEVFTIVKGNEKAMMEKDIFPILAANKRLYGFRCDGLWFDTGTPERYGRVKKEWRLKS